MDATALYPSTMMQFNISFDAYYGYVIDPVCYKTINMLNQILGTVKNYPDGLHNNVFEFVSKYVEWLSPQNKNDYKQIMYYMIMNLFIKLKQVNIPLKELLKPNSQGNSIILKVYLIPLIELMMEIHPKSEEYNTFAHDYLLNCEITPDVDKIFIVENSNDPTIRINWIDADKIGEYLTTKNLCMNITGALFYTHDHKMGTINQFLVDRLGMRKQYKKKRDEHTPGSDEYKEFDHRQKVMKVNANSSYGLTGMSGFRFSNKWLAKSTTINGRLALKISQICGEMYLNEQSKV